MNDIINIPSPMILEFVRDDKDVQKGYSLTTLDGDVVSIWMIYVEPDARGKGIGKKMIDIMKSKAQKIITCATTIEMRGLLDKCGFECQGDGNPLTNYYKWEA
jgi:ribosomal protein S18 acetylase RimI-like enzyme